MREREADISHYEQVARQSAYGGTLANAVSKSPPSGVLHQLDVLEKLVAEALALMDRLGARLEPITESAPECPRGTAVRDSGFPAESSQVGQRLETLSLTLRELCGRIDGQHNRIRL